MKKERTYFYEDKNIKIDYFCKSDSSMFFFIDRGGLIKLKIVIENKTEDLMDVDVVDFEAKGSGLSGTPNVELIHGLKGGKTAIKIFCFDSYVEEMSFNIRYIIKEKGIDCISSERFVFGVN